MRNSYGPPRKKAADAAEFVISSFSKGSIRKPGKQEKRFTPGILGLFFILFLVSL